MYALKAGSNSSHLLSLICEPYDIITETNFKLKLQSLNNSPIRKRLAICNENVNNIPCHQNAKGVGADVLSDVALLVALVLNS